MGGFGEKRLRAVRESLAARGRVAEGLADDHAEFQQQIFEGGVDLTSEIPVSEILDIDDEYRYKATHNQLPRIAPRSHNPDARAWLPILHTDRDERHYTALFSNTEHAHAMGTTHDWVVIYLEDHRKRGQHGRWTVITSRFGKLRGKRIVRGREKECLDYYNERVA
jgi:putative hydrolase